MDGYFVPTAFFHQAVFPLAPSGGSWQCATAALDPFGNLNRYAMARSDLLIKLVKAGALGDQPLFRKTVEAVIAEERGKNHTVLADRLAGQRLRRAETTVTRISSRHCSRSPAHDSSSRSTPQAIP